MAFKYGEGLEVAQFAWLLEGGPEYEVGTQTTIYLEGEGEQFEKGETISAGDFDLTLAANAEIVTDELSFRDEADKFVAGAFEDASDWPNAVDVLSERAELVFVFGVGPAHTAFCPPAELSVSVPDDADLEPGQAVDFYLHITDSANRWGKYGDWGKVSSGQVSDDGERIVTAEGGGIPELGTLAIALSDDE
jgi:hypothetical protein